MTHSEQQVLLHIERARRARPRVKEERITLAHGAGGKATQTLIEAIFLDAFRNPLLEPLEDAAELTVESGRLAFTTDSYVVSPLFFPGGCIGDLAVNGTVNDLAVSGAHPMYLPAGFVLEEGLPVADLTRIVAAMSAAAEAAGVRIVTGDTKVVQRGKADGCYITTAGVGVLDPATRLGVATARPGDTVLVSGPVGDHGITVLLARGELDIEGRPGLRHRAAARAGGRSDGCRAGPAGDAGRHPGRRGHHPQRGRAGRRGLRRGQGEQCPSTRRGALRV